VTRGSEPTLIRLGQALKRRELNGSTILIAGHTDATGSDHYNLDLSKRRAEAIKAYLNRYFGLDADKLITVGFGEEKLNPGIDDPYSSGHRRVQITNLTQ
ncbi:MAG: OmpA family protein, partial [Methyloligellaceae bacterium]